MAIRRLYPYTNFHDLNLDVIIERVNEAEAAAAASAADVAAAAADMAAADAKATLALSTANSASNNASNAVNTANSAINTANNTAILANNALNAVNELAANLNTGYKELYQKGGYCISDTTNITSNIFSAGLLIDGVNLLICIDGVKTIANTTFNQTFKRIFSFDNSITDFIPSAFYGRGIAYLNGELVVVVASYGQDPNFFQDGIWFKPVYNSITTGNNEITQSLYASPIIITKFEVI